MSERERERERERECVCVCERESVCVCMCVCVCSSERGRQAEVEAEAEEKTGRERRRGRDGGGDRRGSVCTIQVSAESNSPKAVTLYLGIICKEAVVERLAHTLPSYSQKPMRNDSKPPYFPLWSPRNFCKSRTVHRRVTLGLHIAE